MLCCDVLMFVVKQGVPSDGDLEWLYPSCLLYGKYFLRAFRSIANWRYKWFVTKSVYLAMAIFLTGWKKENKTSSVRVCGCAFFVLNDAQLGCIMQWHQLALKQIHQKRFIREGISSIATYQLFHCPSVGSNNMLCSNYFFTFVIMQVILLNICLGQR